MLSFPNILSLMRLILIPFFMHAFLNQQSDLFIVVFSIAGFSDFLDGFIARRLNISSNLGHLLDTLADIPFYTAAIIVLFFSYPNAFINNSVLVYIFTITGLMPSLMSLFFHKKIYLEHTKIYKLFSSMLFFVVLSSFYLNVSAMIPILLSGFIIANIHLCHLIFKRRLT